jgi:AraC-like DNA-binding protein
MSGIDVVRALRANGATTPMVIVTAFPSLDSSFDAATVGAAGYVEGMLLPDELLEVVSHALAGRLPVRHPGGDTAVTAMPAHPDDPVRTDPRVREMIRAIDARLSRSLSPGEIAGVLHMSESRVRHLFKVSVGVPLMTFAKERRLQTSALRLATTTDYVSQIAAALGFGSAREFAKSFRKRFGMPPKVYRARFWRGFRHRE